MAPFVIMSMKISGAEQLKAFGSALHFLRSVGKELRIETDPGSLILRALNDARSVYASVEFMSGFFDVGSFRLNGEAQSQANSNSYSGTANEENTQSRSFACCLPVKYLCGLTKNFRNTLSLALRAETSREDGCELVVEMLSANNIKRTHRFKYSDTEVISAVYDDEGASSLRCMYKVRRLILMITIIYF